MGWDEVGTEWGWDVAVGLGIRQDAQDASDGLRGQHPGGMGSHRESSILKPQTIASMRFSGWNGRDGWSGVEKTEWVVWGVMHGMGGVVWNGRYGWCGVECTVWVVWAGMHGMGGVGGADGIGGLGCNARDG
eukprot:309972-Chlamydomonas_euryale.AAC.2